MFKPSRAWMEWGRRLLAQEGAAGGAATCAAAAGRVYDKLQAQLNALLGVAGVRALFVRSAKLNQGEFACLAEPAVLESSTTLRERLQAQEPTIAEEAAAALFGTFLALLSLFVGERLTAQALRRTWPTITEVAPAPTMENLWGT